MGSGNWSTNVYSAAASYRAATGASAFAYSDSGARVVHENLDPAKITVRESRDSDEHPTSLAISVLFDVTGSMMRVPRALQEKLPQLFGLLLRKGYVEHPQIMFGAIGDATCDRVPLQLGQFESDNRMDDDLGRIVLEGGGGGQMKESYELAMYALARKTDMDCLNKRGKKGYLFIIGDELPYPRVKSREVAAVLGDELGEDIGIETILAELRTKFEVYYILPAGSSYAGDPRILDYWRGLLGERAIGLDDLDAVCETIALAIGLNEGTIDLDEGLDDLREIGSKAGGSVGKALAHVTAGAGVMATSAAPAGLDTGTDDVDRL